MGSYKWCLGHTVSIIANLIQALRDVQPHPQVQASMLRLGVWRLRYYRAIIVVVLLSAFPSFGVEG